jgi:hypothetical protein
MAVRPPPPHHTGSWLASRHPGCSSISSLHGVPGTCKYLSRPAAPAHLAARFGSFFSCLGEAEVAQGEAGLAACQEVQVPDRLREFPGSAGATLTQALHSVLATPTCSDLTRARCITKRSSRALCQQPASCLEPALEAGPAQTAALHKALCSGSVCAPDAALDAESLQQAMRLQPPDAALTHSWRWTSIS